MSADIRKEWNKRKRWIKPRAAIAVAVLVTALAVLVGSTAGLRAANASLDSANASLNAAKAVAALGQKAPLPCDYTDSVLSCTIPQTTITSVTTETVTSPPVTVTETTTAQPTSTTSTTASTVPSSTSTSTTTSTPPTTTTVPTNPSGEAMPVGNLPGWTQVMSDDFAGTTLSNTKWFASGYSGEIPSAPGAYWSGEQVQVRDGKLVLETEKYASNGRWTSGGVMARQSLTYGKILIRTRMDKAAGVKYAHLLWPQSPDTWYTGGEIDFAEDGGGNRTGTTGTVIWFINGQANSKNQIQRSVSADFSQWHTLGVEWSPGKLVYTLDGAPFGTVEHPSGIPDGPMRMALQTEALLTCSQWNTCVNATTPALTTAEFDWVSLYTRN